MVSAPHGTKACRLLLSSRLGRLCNGSTRESRLPNKEEPADSTCFGRIKKKMSRLSFPARRSQLVQLISADQPDCLVTPIFIALHFYEKIKKKMSRLPNEEEPAGPQGAS